MIKILTNPIVTLVVALLLGVGTGLGMFMKAAKPMIAAVKAARAKAVKTGEPEAPWGFWTLEIENIAAELKDQRAVIKKMEEELKLRAERLNAERQEIAKQREQLETMRADINNRVVAIQASEIKNLKTLVATYSDLTPKALLTLFKDMDDTMVVKLISLMKKDVTTPLFEEMSKQAATDPLIARRASVITEKLRLLQTSPAP